MAATKQNHQKVILIFLTLVLIALTSYRLLSLWGKFLPDFSVFYFSTLGLLHGISPYSNTHLFTAFIYPIFTNLVYLPFILFPFPISKTIFLCINILLLPLVIYIILRILNKLNLVNFLVINILASLSFPIKFTLGMGQSNLIAYAFLLGGYFYFVNKKQSLSSILTALSVIFKPTFAFLFLFYVLKKQWKTIVVCFYVIAAFIIVSGVLFGFNYFADYMAVVPDSAHTWSPEPYYNQGIKAFFSRLIGNPLIEQLLTYFIDLLFLVTTIYFSWTKKISANSAFSLFLVTQIMIDPISWQHHFVFLLFPFVFAFFQISKQKKSRKFLYSLLAISYILVSININSPMIFKSSPQILILSHAFYGAVILFVLLLKLKTYE